MVKFADGC